jgi:hypothetical protein
MPEGNTQAREKLKPGGRGASGKNNFFAWRKVVGPFMQKEFGSLVKFINGLSLDEAVLYEPPPIVNSDFDPPGLLIELTNPQKASLYTDLLKKRNSTLKDLQDKAVAAWAALQSEISDESWSTISAEAGFDEAKLDSLVHILWNIIVKTHVTKIDALNVDAMRYAKVQVEMDFIDLKMDSKQSISDFKEEFKNAMNRAIGAGVPEPDQAEQAVRFLKALDKRRYSPMQVEVLNNIQLGRAPPQTLEEMYRAAASREELVTKTESGAAGKYELALLAGEVPQPQGQGRPPRHRRTTKPSNSKDGGQKKDEPQGTKGPAPGNERRRADARNDDQPRELKCHRCRQVGHPAFKCNATVSNPGTAEVKVLVTHSVEVDAEEDELFVGVAFGEIDKIALPERNLSLCRESAAPRAGHGPRPAGGLARPPNPLLKCRFATEGDDIAPDGCGYTRVDSTRGAGERGAGETSASMQEHGAHPVCHSSSLNNPLPILALGVHLPTGTPFTKYEVLLDVDD